MFSLNRTASQFLQHLAEGNSEAEIIDQICRQFNIPREQISSDFQQLLNTLLENRLVGENSEPLL